MGDAESPPGNRWPYAAGARRPARRRAGRPAARRARVRARRNVRDPGNAGTVIRGADAAGADASSWSATRASTCYNRKVVRSTVGSLWHLPIVRRRPIQTILGALRAQGIRLLAADGAGHDPAPDARPGRDPHAWVMGNEAWGLRGAGARRLRRGGPRADLRARRVAQPRHGGDPVSLRIRGGEAPAGLSALNGTSRSNTPAGSDAWLSFAPWAPVVTTASCRPRLCHRPPQRPSTRSASCSRWARRRHRGRHHQFRQPGGLPHPRRAPPRS